MKRFLETLIVTAIGLAVRTPILGTMGWFLWNYQWHDWFAAPPVTWTQACGAVFILNFAAGDFGPQKKDHS